MKIAIWHNLPSGGGKRAMYDHIVGLLERGHEIEVWCPPTADVTYLPLSELVTEHIVPLNGPDSSLSISEQPASNVNPRERLSAMDEHCRRCAKEINAGGFDVLYAHPCKFLAVSSIGRHVSCPTVLYLQEPQRYLYEAMPRFLWTAIPDHSQGRPWWLAPNYARWYWSDFKRIQGLRVYVREEYESAKAFDSILVNSLFSRESLLRAYGLDSHVCYLGVDSVRFQPTGSPREDFVLSVGSLSPPKNPEFVIRAVGQISAQRRPNLYWVTNFSNTEYGNQLQKLAEDLEVKLITQTRVSDVELRDLLSRARAFVYAPRLEPFGFAPLEANACGTPAVATAEGGIRETVQHEKNGLICQPEPDQMASAIERLLDDPELADRLGKDGRSTVEEIWSLSSSIDRVERWLKAAVSARS